MRTGKPAAAANRFAALQKVASKGGEHKFFRFGRRRRRQLKRRGAGAILKFFGFGPKLSPARRVEGA